jgi:hypothetical protein
MRSNPKEYEWILAKQPKLPTMRGISKALRDLLARSAAIISAAYSLSVVPATSYGLEVEALSDHHHQRDTAAIKKNQNWISTRGYVDSFSNDDEITMDPRRRQVDELFIVNDGPGMLN